MKNLIYTICDEPFYPLFELWIEKIKEFYSDDVLVITSESMPDIRNDVIVHRVPGVFDYKYMTKFEIINVSSIHQYDNILYLDLDIFVQKSLDQLFKVISDDPSIIHGVIEKLQLSRCDSFHIYHDPGIVIPTDSPAFNAGTFGFNIKSLPTIQSLYKFIENNRDKAICDQPLFNMYLTSNGKIKGSLSPFVF